MWQSTWHTPILDAQENFLDALHTHTIHNHLVRRSGPRHPVEVELQLSGDGFRVDYKGQPKQSGLLYRLFESKRLGERAYFSALGVAQLEYRYAAGWTIWITLYFTPETDESTRVFATLHVAGRFAPSWLLKALVWPFVQQVVRQDRLILEHQRAHGESFPERQPVTTPLDIVRPFLESAWRGAPPTETSVRRTLYL
jgi:phenylpropionate dioxygenase-like ring-hydroxylating dioxygenase large terminal subunit